MQEPHIPHPDDHGVLNDIDDAFYKDLVANVRRKLGPSASNNEVQPESIVQSVLRSAMQKNKVHTRSIEDLAQLKAFLIVKARYKILDRKRKKRPDPLASLRQDEGRGDIESAIPADDQTPDRIVSGDEQVRIRGEAIDQAIGALFAKLHPDDRRIVEMRVFDDKAWSTIGPLVGRTPGAARKRYCTVLKPKLKEAFGLEIDEFD